ncbi:MAG TPA: hypothetical protein VLG36_03435 [Candidatus Chromulinivoraceae bacterium]|nr:hypothetical protein [Candidatus Chromulinivoraceae bacterium]
MHTIILAAVPHVLKPVATPTWITQLMLSMLAVIAADQWADRIPGVNKLGNRIPQVIVLMMTATAVSTLQDTHLIGSFSKRLIDLSNQLGAGLSGLWNIGGVVVAVILAVIFGFRYMNSEKLFWDGFLFGLVMTALATLVPWVGYALEFWRYSFLTGFINVATIVVGWAGNLSIS